jgi:hypothetical protein
MVATLIEMMVALNTIDALGPLKAWVWEVNTQLP